MKNKVLVEVKVPSIEEKYDVYLPVNKKIGNVIILLCKAVNDFTHGIYVGNTSVNLYNDHTGEKYDIDLLLRNTDITNGSVLVLM